MSEVVPLNWQDSTTLICKPEQSGKTFIMIHEIIKEFQEPIHDKKVLNTIFCDNNLFLTKQTSDRINEDLRTFTVSGETYMEFSSHKRTKYHNMHDIAWGILTTGTKNIICCTNGQRMDDIYQLIEQFNTIPELKDKYYFKIWLDEADKFIKFISNTIRPIIEKFPNSTECFWLTATPDPLFKAFDTINVFPLEETTTKDYHSWKDNKIIPMEFSGNYIDFIQQSLNMFKTINNVETLPNGSIWFIPGRNEKKTHNVINNLMVTLMVKRMVNGKFSFQFNGQFNG